MKREEGSGLAWRGEESGGGAFKLQVCPQDARRTAMSGRLLLGALLRLAPRLMRVLPTRAGVDVGRPLVDRWGGLHEDPLRTDLTGDPKGEFMLASRV